MKGEFKNRLFALYIVVGLLLGSCGEDVDPSMADVKLEIKGTTQLNTINANARIAESGVEFTDFVIGVTEIEFEGLEGSHSDDDDDKSGDDSDDDSDDDGDDDSNGSDDDNDDGSHDDAYEIEFQGQFIVDLLEGTSDPDFGIADVIPGVYKEIELKLRPILDDGNSIFVRFNYTPDGMEDPLTVEFSSNKELEFELENHSGIQLDGNTLNQVLILFDLDKFLANIDLSTADIQDGVIKINSSSNSALATKLLSNFHQSCKAGEDDDDDDKFDDDDSDDD